MATKEQMEQLLSELGVYPSDTIILYDAKADVDAARLWWILRFYGHHNVRLLNGGLKAWQAIGGKLTSEENQLERTEFNFNGTIDSTIYATIDQVWAASEYGTAALIDTRSTEEFTGEKLKNGAAWPGHIKSAINLDWPTSVAYSGNHRFLSKDSLLSLYSEIESKNAVITYCHSGVRSSHTLFVLTELLGYQNVRNYDGSWTEWSHLKDE